MLHFHSEKKQLLTSETSLVESFSAKTLGKVSARPEHLYPGPARGLGLIPMGFGPPTLSNGMGVSSENQAQKKFGPVRARPNDLFDLF